MAFPRFNLHYPNNRISRSFDRKNGEIPNHIAQITTNFQLSITGNWVYPKWFEMF